MKLRSAALRRAVWLAALALLCTLSGGATARDRGESTLEPAVTFPACAPRPSFYGMEISPDWSPPRNTKSVFDGARRQFLVFGANEKRPFGSPGRTLIWDGKEWAKHEFPDGPIGRKEPGMVYDPERRHVLFFGGEASGKVKDPDTREGTWKKEVLDDTWSWDGTSWTQLKPANSPQARTGHAMVYDSARKVVVLFGGWDGRVDLDDVWEWDGATWTERKASTRPSARAGHALAYDPTRQRVLLFGGDDELGVHYTDTWEWDGARWQELKPNVSPPAGFPRAGYDTARGRILVCLGGGFWEWDGKAWSDVTPPTPRYGGETPLAFDSARQRIVLFSGNHGGGTGPADTWEFDGANWEKKSPAKSPPPRRRHAMAYDSKRKRTVLFGGFRCDTDGCNERGGTWEWDGDTWEERKPAHSPPAMQSHSMAYDPARKRVVLVGSVSKQATDGRTRYHPVTWEWDGTDWKDRTPDKSPGTGPIVYDPSRRRVVLVTADCSEPVTTWLWNGSRWKKLRTKKAPSSRREHLIAYDRRRGRLVMMGGQRYGCGGDIISPISEVWELRGRRWKKRDGHARVSLDASAVYDGAQREIVLFNGGQRGTQKLR